MHLLVIVILVALVYFPIVWIAGRLGGERLQTATIIAMVAAVLFGLLAIPVCFYLFLRYCL